jgi:hypothetical protein
MNAVNTFVGSHPAWFEPQKGQDRGLDDDQMNPGPDCPGIHPISVPYQNPPDQSELNVGR